MPQKVLRIDDPLSSGSVLSAAWVMPIWIPCTFMCTCDFYCAVLLMFVAQMNGS